MKNRQLLTLSGAILAGIVFSASYAQALTFSYNAGNSGAGTFSYDVTLDAGEDFDLGDPLVLTGLGGITTVDSDDNLDLQFTNGFDSISDNFTVSNAASGAQILTNAIILSSNNPLGTINYSASTSAGAFDDTTQGPVAAVPFEPSADLGIFILLGLMGLNYCYKNFKA